MSLIGILFNLKKFENSLNWTKILIYLMYLNYEKFLRTITRSYWFFKNRCSIYHLKKKKNVRYIQVRTNKLNVHILCRPRNIKSHIIIKFLVNHISDDLSNVVSFACKNRTTNYTNYTNYLVCWKFTNKRKFLKKIDF